MLGFKKFLWIFISIMFIGSGFLAATNLPDFVITDLSKTTGNQLVVKVTNYGSGDHHGKLPFKIFENENFKRQLTMTVDLPVGQTREITLDYQTTPISCGRWFQVIVNPDNLLPEANGNHGNSIMKRLFAKCYRVKLANRAHFGKGPVKIVISDGVNVPSVRITPDLCEKITKVSERGITASVNYLKVKLPVEVFLKNCGYCNPIHDVWIKIMEGTSRQLVYLRKVMSANPGSTFTVKATPEFKFTPNSNGSSTVFTIRFEGGFRQSGGNMSIREGSPPMFVRVIFSGFRNYL